MIIHLPLLLGIDSHGLPEPSGCSWISLTVWFARNPSRSYALTYFCPSLFQRAQILPQ
jgi:hypothetical protein